MRKKNLYKDCLRRMHEASMLAEVGGLAGWDQETMMPPRAAASRAAQLSALAGVIHEKVVDPKLGEAFRTLAARPAGLTADERVCVREWLRDYERAVKLPTSLVRELARVGSLAQDAWIKARKASDFAAFAPWLTKMIALKRREAEALGYEGHPYDALLDGYEPAMTVAELDPIVARLVSGLVPIVRAIAESGRKPDTSCLSRRTPEAGQEALCREVMGAMGVDRDAARLDRSAHPFCCGLTPTDVRITTRYDERWLAQSLYGVIHESGHALYEQGLPEKRLGTPLCEAASLGIHESQSRLWENFIGRSRPFAAFLLPRLRKHLGKAMARVTPDAFHAAVNRVGPSPIRVEADEVTYNLHIALRYELEKQLLEGAIRVRDLPRLWNDGMRRFLGVTPKNDAEGVLQDTHWAMGLIGYFPTYLLGNLYAAQFWARIQRQIPDAPALIARGQFASILGWLRTHVHRHARRFRPAELLLRATGRPLDSRFFLDYLKAKYGKLYDIRSW